MKTVTTIYPCDKCGVDLMGLRFGSHFIRGQHSCETIHIPPPVPELESDDETVSVDDRTELLQVSYLIGMFLIAWKKNDEMELHKLVSELDGWTRKRNDRLTALNLGRKIG